MKPYLFIINPKSGTKKKHKLIDAIPAAFSDDLFDIEWTTHAGHGADIALDAAQSGRRCVVAIGGDGTINEVASGLIFSDTALAMIPTGSGNGFARHFNVPMNPLSALASIQAGKVLEIDTLTLNGRFFINVAGMGFDARIAHAFAKMGKRGLLSYVKAVLANIRSYTPETYQLITPEETLRARAFLISFANASQYGNEAQIAPGAVVDDGRIEVCIMKPFPLLAATGILIRIFTGKIRGSRYYHSFSASSLEVVQDHEIEVHLDGEPCLVPPHFKIRNHRRSLKIIVPS
jgi:YegS/Rv2252/BmrU family lipid kinase